MVSARKLFNVKKEERKVKNFEITVVLACPARVKFNGRRHGDLERNFNGRRKRERCGKTTSLRSGIDVL